MSHPSPAQASRLTVFTLMLMSFFWAFGNPVVNPLLPSIMNHFELTPVRTTLLITMYALPGLFVIPVLGFLEDRLGRKPILVGSLLVSIVAFFGISTADSFKTMLAWRVLQGLAVTPMESLCNTIISDTFDNYQERARFIGASTSILFIGVAVYPLISIAVLGLLGWRAAIASPVAIAIILVPLCWRLPMRYHASQFSMAVYLADMRRLLVSRRLLSLFGVRMFLSLMMFGAMYSYMPFLVTSKLGAPESVPGLLFSLYAAFQSLGSIFLGRLIAAFGPARLGVTGGLLVTAAMLGYLLAPSVNAILAPLCLCGAGIGILSALVTTQVSQCASPETRASIMSLYSTAFRAAQAAAPPLFSLFYLAGHFDMLYGISAGLAALMAGLAWFALKPDRAARPGKN